jgi:hypothetical protein
MNNHFCTVTLASLWNTMNDSDTFPLINSVFLPPKESFQRNLQIVQIQLAQAAFMAKRTASPGEPRNNQKQSSLQLFPVKWCLSTNWNRLYPASYQLAEEIPQRNDTALSQFLLTTARITHLCSCNRHSLLLKRSKQKLLLSNTQRNTAFESTTVIVIMAVLQIKPSLTMFTPRDKQFPSAALAPTT